MRSASLVLGNAKPEVTRTQKDKGNAYDSRQRREGTFCPSSLYTATWVHSKLTPLQQWDRADDIGASAEWLRADWERLRSELTSAQTTLDNRRREILDALNEEFRETVRALGIPSIRTAEIHPANFLPVLNGRSFIDIPSALYRRLVTQADASPGQVQFIVADNQLPAAYRHDYDEIDFTYQSPTVSTVEHPGPDAVESIKH